MFATWFMLKKINPKNVIESGIWKGLGTWLIEKTLPNANIFSIDLNLKLREYKSAKVQYFDKDFSKIDWSFIKEKDNTVLFFDDHQNAYERIKIASKIGFKQIIFEDNYPAIQGDCYTLKKVFQHAGYKDVNRGIIKKIFNIRNDIKPNSEDANYLKNVLNIYYEFSPIFRANNTRWGDEWNSENYPTPKPLYEKVEQTYLKIFKDEVSFYTWICFAKLK